MSHQHQQYDQWAGDTQRRMEQLRARMDHLRLEMERSQQQTSPRGDGGWDSVHPQGGPYTNPPPLGSYHRQPSQHDAYPPPRATAGHGGYTSPRRSEYATPPRRSHSAGRPWTSPASSPYGGGSSVGYGSGYGSPHSPQSHDSPYRSPSVGARRGGDWGGGGRKKALLVGINYKGQQEELYGCVNDVRTMKRLLEIQGWPVDDQHLWALTEDKTPDMQPTKRNMLRSIDWLMADVQPGDSLFFGFSGHGMQMRDREGDEADGLDEVLVSADRHYIKDDELYNMMVRRLPPGARLTVVTDCCHSGTVLDLPYTMSPGGRVGGGRRRHSPFTRQQGGEVVMFSGCADHQEGADMNMNAGRAGGACTNALVNVLCEWGPSVSHRELLDGMADQLHRRGLPQVPQLSSSGGLDPNQMFTLTANGEPLRPLPRSAGHGLNPLLSDHELDAIPAHALRAGVRSKGMFGPLDGMMGGGDMNPMDFMGGGGGGGGGGFGSAESFGEAAPQMFEAVSQAYGQDQDGFQMSDLGGYGQAAGQAYMQHQLQGQAEDMFGSFF